MLILITAILAEETVQVVGGAVKRIDDPYGIGLTLDAAFFGKYRVIRIVFMNDAYDGLFSRVICVTDVIVMPLFLNLEFREINHFSGQRITGAVRRHYRDIK